MNKYKYLILGFFAGAVMFSFIPVKASLKQYILYKAEYGIIIDGKEFVDQQNPMLNYNGRTYLPLRAVAEILDVDIVWNSEFNQVEIYKEGVVQGKTDNKKDGYEPDLFTSASKTP